jgi:glycosyltransferase involved in cell wall biosynthesis
MSHKNPKISAIMPVYNREKFLDEAIQSVLDQTFEDFEFIIIDDGSTDESVNIIKKYAAKDDRIKLFCNDKNKGISYTRNRGIKIAQSNIIAVVDSDDVNMLERFEIQYNFMKNNSKIAIVGSYAYVIDERGKKTGEEFKYAITQEVVSKSFFYKGPFLQPTTMYNKKDVLDVGGYRDKYREIDEVDLYLRMLSEGKLGSNIPKFLVAYRKHEDSTEKNYKKKRKLLFQLKQEIISYYHPKLRIPDYLYIYGWYMFGFISTRNVRKKIAIFIKKIIY